MFSLVRVSINFVLLTLNIFKSLKAKSFAISVFFSLLISGIFPPVAKIRDFTHPAVSGFFSAFNLRSAVVTKSFRLGWLSLLITFLITFSAVLEVILISGSSVLYLGVSSFSLNKFLRGFIINLETSPRIVPVLGFSFTLLLKFSSAIRSF